MVEAAAALANRGGLGAVVDAALLHLVGGISQGTSGVGEQHRLLLGAHQPEELAVPTPHHYLPMLYVAGARRSDDRFTVLVEGVDLGSVSMTAFVLA